MHDTHEFLDDIIIDYTAFHAAMKMMPFSRATLLRLLITACFGQFSCLLAAADIFRDAADLIRPPLSFANFSRFIATPL